MNMDYWYSYTLYPTASPKPPFGQTNKLPSMKPSSSSSDASSKTRGSTMIKKNRRFLFVGKRNKDPDLPSAATQIAITANNSGDFTIREVSKPIAYPSHERFSHTTPRRSTDGYYRSATPKRPQTPVLFRSPPSPQKSLLLHASSEGMAWFGWHLKRPTPTVKHTEPILVSPGDSTKSSLIPAKSLLRGRRSLAMRPLSSESNTFVEVEPSVPIYLANKGPAQFQMNPFCTKHVPRSEQFEVLGSWEEAIDWWYKYGEDETEEKCTGSYLEQE